MRQFGFLSGTSRVETEAHVKKEFLMRAGEYHATLLGITELRVSLHCTKPCADCQKYLVTPVTIHRGRCLLSSRYSSAKH